MPSRERLLKEREDAYLEKLERRGYAHKTLTEYRRIITMVDVSLGRAGLITNPKKVGEREIEHLTKVTLAHMAPSTARWNLSIYGTYLVDSGNHVLREMHIPWPRGSRIHVDWLDAGDALRVLENARGQERMVIHLELLLGLRRVEVARLKVQDIVAEVIHILGKGTQGGKPRTIPIHQDTFQALREYCSLRNEIVAVARSKNPDVVIPDNLMLYEKGGHLYGYQKSSLDAMVKRVSLRTGLRFSNHTLRRTFGRMAWHAGVPIETISKFMGHEDIRQTIRYLGLNLDDMQKGMRKMCQYQNALKSGRIWDGQEMEWAQGDLDS